MPSVKNECPSNTYFTLYFHAALYITSARARSVDAAISKTSTKKKTGKYHQLPDCQLHGYKDQYRVWRGLF